MKINIMEWNIHQQGRQWTKETSSIDSEISLSIIDKIKENIKEETSIAGIAILTEFNSHARNIEEFYKKLTQEGFSYSTTSYTCEWSNDILIVISGEKGEEVKVNAVSYTKAYPDAPYCTSKIAWEKIPENIHIDISVNQIHILLFGIRVKSLKSYDDRKKEFDMLMKWVEKVDNKVIVLGDFNNAKCRGKLNQKYNKEDYIYLEKRQKREYAQINYNLNIIKDTFTKAGYEMMDISESGEPIMTHRNENGYEYPEDHIFTKGFKKNQCKSILVGDLSDHDIIWATVEID